MNRGGIERVLIVGVGLLGASIGLGIKKHALAAQVTGVGRNQASLDIALQRNAIDAATLDLEQAVPDASLIIIAVPASQTIAIMDQAAPLAAPNAVLLDVASTKRLICAHANTLFPAPRRFVGCHPMAGSEKFGPEHARDDLYENTICLMEQDDAIAPDARELVQHFWAALGAQIKMVNPAQHDLLLARTSHVPHILASALAQLAETADAPHWVVGGGFRDMTRIAASRPEIWRDICLENASAIAESLAQLRTLIAAVESCVAEKDAASIEQFFMEGAAARKKVLEP